MQPVGISSHPVVLSIDELIAHDQNASGINVENRSWYRAFSALKMRTSLTGPHRPRLGAGDLGTR